MEKVNFPVELDKFIRKKEWRETLFFHNDKKISADSSFTPEGVVSTRISVWYRGRMVESFWGLPLALEFYNKL